MANLNFAIKNSKFTEFNLNSVAKTFLVDADGHYYDLQLLEKGMQFSRYIYFGHLVAIFWNSDKRNRLFGWITPPPYRSFSKFDEGIFWCWKLQAVFKQLQTTVAAISVHFLAILWPFFQILISAIGFWDEITPSYRLKLSAQVSAQ